MASAFTSRTEMRCPVVDVILTFLMVLKQVIVGLMDGEVDGEVLGDVEGLVLGLLEGDADGLVEGDADGLVVGLVEGDADGLVLGLVEGDVVGLVLGLVEGEADGLAEGEAVVQAGFSTKFSTMVAIPVVFPRFLDTIMLPSFLRSCSVA